MSANGRGRPRKDATGKRRDPKFGRSLRAQTKFRDALIPVAKKLVAEGRTDMEIADLFGVAYCTLNDWKVKVPALARAMKRGEALNTKAVEAAMIQRAQGYAHQSEKIFMHRGKIVRAKTEERFAPDVAAGKLVLAAKNPEEYGDKLELAGNRKRPIEFVIKGLYDKDHPPPAE